MSMPDEDQMGRQAHFDDGASGLMAGTHPSTVLPVQQANPEFQGGSSSLFVPSEVKSVNGMSDRTFLTSMMPAMSQGSPFQKAQAGEQAQEKEMSDV